jgi:hypothetical protein
MPSPKLGLDMSLARCVHGGLIGGVLGSAFSAFCLFDDALRDRRRLSLASFPGALKEVLRDGFQASRVLTLGMGAMCLTSMALHGMGDYERLSRLPSGGGNEASVWVGCSVAVMAGLPASEASFRVRAGVAAALATGVTLVMHKVGASESRGGGALM